MADQFKYKKLPSDPCLTQEQMMAYIDGKLSAADQHACERHMADCGMCEDALEGLMLVDDRSVLSVPLKTEKSEATEGKVVPLNPPSPNRKLWYAAAAILVVVLGSVYFLRTLNEPTNNTQMADNSRADSVSSPMHDEPIAAEKFDSTQSFKVSAEDENSAGPKTVISAQEAQSTPRASNWQQINARSQSGAADLETTDDISETPAVVTEKQADGDALGVTFDQTAPVQPDVKLKEENEEVTMTDEQNKKPTFWDKTKAAVEQTGTVVNESKRSETQDRKDSYVGNDDRKNDAKDNNAPASPEGNTDSVSLQYPAPAAGTSAPTHVAASVPQDTGRVMSNGAAIGDQQELSYQNGVSLMNSGQPNTAITLFDQVLADKNNPRYEDAEFQKANALIKANRKEEAKTLLKAIEAKKGKHASEATALLKTL